MDEIFSYIPIVTTILVFKIFVLNVDSYDLQCPSQPNWTFRAKVKCNSTSKYFCLYNRVDGIYVEGCNGPDWDRKGSKRIYIGDFSRGNCSEKRFQPLKFWTNESMSDCIYVKSNCSEDGQIVYMDHSPKNDRRCRCDNKKNYSFIKTPRNGCYCIPTEEDCSCYIKTCPVNFTLSEDYDCIPMSYQETPKCINITRYSETTDENKWVLVKNDHLLLNETSLKSKTNYAHAFFGTLFISIIGLNVKYQV
ncbi:uncharacterized protein LOC134718131 [Mytilus trossulus]|uniref:uncharacterized protein LOC134718131 n=1 Tax=Mytilus trossulus TaxID=6551 RepID=UPI003007156A